MTTHLYAAHRAFPRKAPAAVLESPIYLHTGIVTLGALIDGGLFRERQARVIPMVALPWPSVCISFPFFPLFSIGLPNMEYRDSEELNRVPFHVPLT